MGTTTDDTAATGGELAGRILREGYGPGAWHGADLKAACADVSAELAFWRLAPGRHSIAEIAVHHAYYVHSVRGRMSVPSPEPFALNGDDWFELESGTPLSWPAITQMLEEQQSLLATLTADLGAGRVASRLPEAERLDLVIGITCHAVYHAGQIQLIKVLHRDRRG